jgi:hypothetical protein
MSDNLDIIEINKEMLSIQQYLENKNYNIDLIYIDKFWWNLENDKWIVVDDELIEWVGYKDIHKGKEKYYYLLKQHFEKDVDYKVYNNEEFKELKELFYPPLGGSKNKQEKQETRGGGLKKNIILSPDCFQESLMLLKTEKSKQIKKSYIELKKIFKEYTTYQLEYQNNKLLELENKQGELEEKISYKNKLLEEEKKLLGESKQELDKMKEKYVDLSHKMFNYKELKENTYLYIATNKTLSLQNNYKVGVTKNLNLRVINFNNTHNINDKFYFTYTKKIHNAYVVEYIVKHILKEFKNSDQNEIYILDYKYLTNLLDSIINNYNNIIEYYNGLMKNYYINNNSVIQEPIDIEPEINDNPETIKQEVEEDHINNDNVENIKYYNKNIENAYYEYKNENNKKLFKCLKCNYVFNRVDNLQNHFNRQIKCNEDIKFKMIQEIKKHNDNPIIKIVEVDNCEINSNYTYYEKYHEKEDEIIYYCNNCVFQTDKLNILKNHYIKKKIKCYNESTEQQTEFIYKNNQNKDCKYYKFSNTEFKCDLCDYIGTKSNICRHFDKKIKCYTESILLEDGDLKYYIEYKNRSKTFRCYHCNYISKNQQHVIRHLMESKNKCYK